MKVKPKSPTQKEKIAVYEQLLHDLQFYYSVAMRPEVVKELLNRIDSWSYAHRSGNGELSEAEQQDQINHAFWRLRRPNS